MKEKKLTEEELKLNEVLNKVLNHMGLPSLALQVDWVAGEGVFAHILKLALLGMAWKKLKEEANEEKAKHSANATYFGAKPSCDYQRMCALHLKFGVEKIISIMTKLEKEAVGEDTKKD